MRDEAVIAALRSSPYPLSCEIQISNINVNLKKTHFYLDSVTDMNKTLIWKHIESIE